VSITTIINIIIVSEEPPNISTEPSNFQKELANFQKELPHGWILSRIQASESRMVMRITLSNSKFGARGASGAPRFFSGSM